MKLKTVVMISGISLLVGCGENNAVSEYSKAETVTFVESSVTREETSENEVWEKIKKQESITSNDLKVVAPDVVKAVYIRGKSAPAETGVMIVGAPSTMYKYINYDGSNTWHFFKENEVSSGIAPEYTFGW